MSLVRSPELKDFVVSSQPEIQNDEHVDHNIHCIEPDLQCVVCLDQIV